MHNNNLELFKRHALWMIKRGDKVLELGPDWVRPGGMCKPLIEEAKASYNFCSLDNNGRNRTGYVPMNNGYSIDAEDDTFDVVFSLSVAEHVPKLWDWLREQKRVLKPKGLLICVNPVSWPYHPSPVDCWRIYPDGYKALFELIDIDHVFSYTGNVVPIEPQLQGEHGPHQVQDTIVIGSKK